MASIFLKSNTTLTLFLGIFSALSIFAICEVLDTDGDMLINGGSYYIIPQSIGAGGGLVPTSGSDSPCPYKYITRSKDETHLGSPVTITSPLRIPFIAPGDPVTISFGIEFSICLQSLEAWQVVSNGPTGQSYVTAGGDDFLPIFTIEDDGGRRLYKIKYISDDWERKDVGFFEKNGFLGITNEIPMPVVFRKASSNLRAMKV